MGPEAKCRDNLASLLMDHPASEGEPLLLTRERIVTAGEARRRAREVAAELEACGVRPGDAVALQLPNGPEAVVAMAGAWLAGGIVVPVSDRAPDAERARIMESIPPAGIIDRNGIHPGTAGRGLRPDGAAFVTWTSGTTGTPKAIVHTHAGYIELIDRVLHALRGEPPDGDRRVDASANPRARSMTPTLIPVQLAQNAGLYNALFGLRAGSALVIMEQFTPDLFAHLVRRFGIRSTVLPPAALLALLDAPQITDLRPLRYVRSITAPLVPAHARRFAERFGVLVLNGYGQAEIGEVIGWTAADARRHPEKVGSVGRPHPGVEVKVVTESGVDASEGDVGELLVRSAGTAVGRADGGDLDGRRDADGYLRTGDLARVDADGYVWIEGRLGDVVNRGGNKVVPHEVEQVLLACAGVKDAAVVGVADERLGEVPVAFVVGGATHGELEDWCRMHLVPYKIPVDFLLRDTLPRTGAGKLDRRRLTAQASKVAREGDGRR